MKALVSIQFALEIEDEDDLVTIAQNIDASMKDAIRRYLESGVDKDTVELMELGGMVDWYGATVAVKKPVFGAMEGGD